MSAASSYGLDRMPDIEPLVAALVLSPGEALRPDARCPRPQCRLTDDHIVRGYNTAARMGRIGNSMSHLILALSQTLQASDVDPSVRDLSDASLQAFGFMARELGRLMSSLTLARRQIWLAQSPLLEPYRRALRTLHVVPGELFGPAAQQALERSLQVTQAREQFSSLRQGQPGRLRPPAAAAVPLAVPRPFSQPPVRRSERFHRQAPAQAPPAAQREQPARRRPYRWKLFAEWCTVEGQVPASCPLPVVLAFLQSRLDAGLAASTIKVYVAAISAQHNRVDGVTVGSHTLVTRFLKGAQRLRPPLRNPVPRWDLPLVLGALSRPPFEPLQDLGLDVLSMKTAFLLAIASARRLQCGPASSGGLGCAPYPFAVSLGRLGRGGERGKLRRRGGGVGPEGAQALDSSSGVERGVRCTGSGSQTVQGSAGGRDVRQAGVGTQAGSQTDQGSAGGRDVRQAGVGTQAGSQTDQGSAGGRDVRQAGVGTQAGSQTDQGSAGGGRYTGGFSDRARGEWLQLLRFLVSLDVHIWSCFLLTEGRVKSALRPPDGMLRWEGGQCVTLADGTSHYVGGDVYL
ncbi:hypothetical protein N1851_018509 [Merluccius polli]|uniref:Core-binding (CB) domain-containing protein n=1 Tax=Merluccius polli TaxID=89951 RepID=A0AA47P1B0_MERPO|nr:hypothetical protein N1851_018509 [Merluccius polli]